MIVEIAKNHDYSRKLKATGDGCRFATAALRVSVSDLFLFSFFARSR
jgi:hypothetical protein